MRLFGKVSQALLVTIAISLSGVGCSTYVEPHGTAKDDGTAEKPAAKHGQTGDALPANQRFNDESFLCTPAANLTDGDTDGEEVFDQVDADHVDQVDPDDGYALADAVTYDNAIGAMLNSKCTKIGRAHV